MKCESKEGGSFNDESPAPPVTSEAEEPAEAVLFDAVNTKNSFDESPGGEDARGGKEGLLNSNMDDSIKDATADACSSKAKAAEGEGEDVLKGAAPAGGRGLMAAMQIRSQTQATPHLTSGRGLN